MGNKIGRNVRCPCGSGKKYKSCCSRTRHADPFDVPDVNWRRLRELEGSVCDRHLFPYVTQALSPEMMNQALCDCLPEDLPEELDQELLFNNFFIPWFLFNWLPFDEFGVDKFDPELTIAQNYVKTHSKQLNSREKRFIEAISQTYYSFYSVLNVEFEKSLVVKDILLETTHTIKERQGTHQLKRGDIIFTRLLTLDKQTISIGMAPFIVPTEYHNDLIDFRNWLIEENNNEALSPDVLRNEFELVLLDYFFDIIRDAFNKPFPTLTNTDGELLQFSTSTFELTITPEEALTRLLPLTLSDDHEIFSQDAEQDKSGNIKRIEFPWLRQGNKKHKAWDNTIMGHIIVEKDKLTLETNSEKRTQRGKKLLNKYLNNAICFQQTLIEAPEKKFASLSKTVDENQEALDVFGSPEAQEQLKAMIKAHWENWFDEPIPALENKTPREAAKTKEGRERLDALLLQYERHDLERGDDNLLKTDVHYLRRELALDKEMVE